MQFGYSNTPSGTARAKGPQEVGQLGVATGRCAFSRASLDSHLDRGASEVEAVPAESEVSRTTHGKSEKIINIQNSDFVCIFKKMN
mgnify:CR=1 FL=1